MWKSIHGESFDGLWEEDKQEGWGTRVDREGRVISGLWSAGELVSEE